MNWDDLRIFLAVAKNRTMKGAAQALAVDASTVTRRLNSLEEATGRLFERVGPNYELTERGRVALGAAEGMEAELGRFTRELARIAAEKKLVRVSFPMLLSSHIAAIMSELRLERPDISLALDASDARVDLAREDVDLVVRIEESPPPELVGRKVGSLPIRVYGSESYRASRPYPIEDERHEWIAWSRDYSEKPPLRYLRAKFPAARFVSEGRNSEAVFQAVQAGIGIAALPAVVGDRAGLSPLVTLPDEASLSVWVLGRPRERESEPVSFTKARLFELGKRLGSVQAQ